MLISVKDVKPLKNYELLLSFDNCEMRIFDMKPYLNKGIYKQLKDVTLFESIKVSFDSMDKSF